VQAFLSHGELFQVKMIWLLKWAKFSESRVRKDTVWSKIDERSQE
jgi:hypothetical protein